MSQTFIEDPPYIKRVAEATIDYIGFGLMALWLASFQIILDKGQEEDWFAAKWIVWTAVISIACMVGFIIRELKTRHPIVELRVLANRNFGLGVILIMIVGAVLYGTTAMLPIFLQTLLGYPALQSGLAVSPRGFGSMASMIIVGRLVGIIDNRYLMAVGFAILAVSVYLLGHVNLDISMTSVIWPNIINGFAMGFIFVPLTTTAMGTLRNEQMGNATGIYNLMRNIGGGLGISLSTTMLARLGQFHQNVLAPHVSELDPAFAQTFNSIKGGLSSMADPYTAGQQAYNVIYGMVQRQSSTLAFIDIFRWEAVVCLACVPLVFILKRGQRRGPPAGVH